MFTFNSLTNTSLLYFSLHHICLPCQALTDVVQTLLVVDLRHDFGRLTQELLTGGGVQLEVQLVFVEEGEQPEGGVHHVGRHQALDCLAVETPRDVGQHRGLQLSK